MTPDDFRRLALALPAAVESAHGDHPDFRVGRKVFASLGWPSGEWAMVSLTSEQQQFWITAKPDAFVPVPGGWGVRGATNVRLARAAPDDVRRAMVLAWRRRAPKSLPAP